MPSFSVEPISGLIKLYVRFRLWIYFKPKENIIPRLTVHALHYVNVFYILLSAPGFPYGDLTLRVGNLCFLAEAMKFDHDRVILKNFLFGLPLAIDIRRITFKISYRLATTRFCSIINRS